MTWPVATSNGVRPTLAEAAREDARRRIGERREQRRQLGDEMVGEPAEQRGADHRCDSGETDQRAEGGAGRASPQLSNT